MPIDHVIYAAADLTSATAALEERLAVAAAGGGRVLDGPAATRAVAIGGRLFAPGG